MGLDPGECWLVERSVARSTKLLQPRRGVLGVALGRGASRLIPLTLWLAAPAGVCRACTRAATFDSAPRVTRTALSTTRGDRQTGGSVPSRRPCTHTRPR